MTSRERMTRAVAFQKPDRLPFIFPIFGDTDVFWLSWKQDAVGDRASLVSKDRWGCTWSRTEVSNMGLVTDHPLKEWEDLERYTFPDPNDPALYAHMAERLEQAGDKYVMTDIFMMLFERLQALRGFENMLMDLYVERENIEALADRIVDHQIAVIQNIASRFPGRIHGLNFSDDWGTETSPMASPQIFDEFFKPRYARIFAEAKKAGWHLFMHSCGKINDLIPSLIDLGVTALNLSQPKTLGIEEIGRRFAGKISFYTCCDIQNTLPTGDVDAIQKEAQQLLHCWGTPNGGFIVMDYGDGAAIGTSDEIKRVMYDAFKDADPYITR